MTSLFGHSVRSELFFLSLVEALVCFGAFYAILLIGIPDGLSSNPAILLLLAGMMALCASFACGATGLYQQKNWLNTGRLISGSLLGATMLVIVTQLAVPQLLPNSSGAWINRLELVTAFVAAVLVTRMAFLSAVHAGMMRQRVALLPGLEGDRLRTALRNDTMFEAVDVPSHNHPDLLPHWLAGQRLRTAITDDPASLPPAQRRALADAGIRVWAATDFAERRLGQVDLDRLPIGWQPDMAARESLAVRVLRRGMDISMSLLLLLLTLPVSLLATLAVKLDSPGPVFYRQQRVGLNGQVFALYKFRSMSADAEKGHAVWATKNDPRVTRVGRFIRLTRIDEIPQVFNVLRGDMAFIGPRPERPEFVSRLCAIMPHYEARASVPPGITGWAQVNYSYGASDADAQVKLTYDLYYVRRRSLFLDLLIIIATVRVVLFQEGAR